MDTGGRVGPNNATTLQAGLIGAMLFRCLRQFGWQAFEQGSFSRQEEGKIGNRKPISGPPGAPDGLLKRRDALQALAFQGDAACDGGVVGVWLALLELLALVTAHWSGAVTGSTGPF